MALGAILERFIEKSPLSVMAQLAVQRAVSTALPLAMSPPRESWLQAMSDCQNGCLQHLERGGLYPLGASGETWTAP